jgi:predicted nucleic acid-binding protein
VYLSVLTLGEIEQGIARSPRPQHTEHLRRWLEDELTPRFEGRILAVDAVVTKTWGQITGQALVKGQPVSLIDSLLAATAIVHGLMFATRNSRDVTALPVHTIDPWQEHEAP